MIHTFRKIIKPLSINPKKLFLIDSIGALLSAFFLFVVLRNFNEYFGMSKSILTYLSAIAACLCIYSTLCFLILKDNCIPFILGLGIANLLYCIFTIGLIVFNDPLITIIGTIYFLLEIGSVCGLVCIELHVATTIKKNIIDIG